MPRSFDMSAEYDTTVEEVHRAFSNEDYWLQRLAGSGADTATLDAMTTHPDGGVEIATTQALRSDRLPALVTQFHPGDLRIVRTEKWGPISHGEAHGVVSAAIPGAPASVSGKAVLTPTGRGSRMELNATVEVNIPLVGGKIEGFIGDRLAGLIVAEQRFTTVWITENP